MNNEGEENKRTLNQNAALHAWCRELATELNDRGLYMQVVLKKDWDILWTEQSVKDNIVRPIAEIVAKTEHTHELNKQQFSQVIDIIDKNLLTKFDINMPFSEEE